MSAVTEMYAGQNAQFAAQKKREEEAKKKMHKHLFAAQVEIIEALQSNFPTASVGRAFRELNKACLQALIIDPEDD